MKITKSLADWGAELNLARQEFASVESYHATILSSSSNQKILGDSHNRMYQARQDLENAELSWQNANAARIPIADGKLRAECPHCALDLGEIPDYT